MITLTASYDPGTADPSGPYAKVKVELITIDVVNEKAILSCGYGNVDEGNWVRGVQIKDVNGAAINPKQYTLENVSGGTQHYDSLKAVVSAGAGESYYEKIADWLEQWLIDESKYVGTVDA